jgi:DNA-binding MarR family transcriptional regulator
VPNKFETQARVLSPWHALLTGATGLSGLMEGEMDRALAIVGLTAREFAALLEIRAWRISQGSTSEPSQRELGARLGLTRGGTSQLVGRLERRALVERQVAARMAEARRGRPRSVLTLTSRGEETLAEAATIARRVENDWARRLAREAAGTDLELLRASGLRRLLTESLGALRDWV